MGRFLYEVEGSQFDRLVTIFIAPSRTVSNKESRSRVAEIFRLTSINCVISTLLDMKLESWLEESLLKVIQSLMSSLYNS